MAKSGRRARQLLLFGRRGERGRDGERAELGGKLDGVEASAGGGPVLGSELEITLARPVPENAEQVAQVELGIEPVQSRGGDEREQVAGGLGVVVAADKEPGAS